MNYFKSKIVSLICLVAVNYDYGYVLGGGIGQGNKSSTVKPNRELLIPHLRNEA